MRKHFLLSLTLFYCIALWAVDPSTTLTTYYAGINGKATDSNDALRVQLCTIISNGYTSIAYGNLQNSVYAASSDPSDFYNGSSKTMEDIYSSKAYVSGDAGSSASDCGTGWNKEHTVPQSWFGEASPMKSDAHHIFPTDIHMNSTRSSYPYGENNASKTCASYGYGHLGSSTFSGYTGTVFDPGDGGANGSYKGDLARVYFYMATRYRTTDFTSGLGSTSFTYSGGVANLTDYMKNLMLKWHREDPVSEKELIRNNAIYAHQKNRNPFVDYPCLVEYIWGDKVGEAVDLSSLVSGYDGVGTDCCANPDDPMITVSATSITLDKTNNGATSTKTFTITGANLTGAISIAKSGSAYITVSPTTISAANANSERTITITYKPKAEGTHTATLTISSTGASDKTVAISGTCATVYTATWMADGTSIGTSTAESGESPAVPSNPTDCSEDRVFKGWTLDATYTSEDGAGLFTTTAPAITENTTFYAVYATASGSGSGIINASKTFTFSEIADANDWSNGTAYTTVEDDPVTLTANGGGNNGKYYTSDKSWRMYNGGSVSITVSNGSVTSVSSTPEQTFTISEGIATLSLTATVKFTAITVNYTASGSSTTYSDFSTSCDGGSVTYVTVSFDANGGTGTMPDQSVKENTATALKANTFTREHYTFAGWNTKANGSGTSYADKANVTIAADLKLYAQWAEDSKYTVTFMNLGGIFTSQENYAGEAITGIDDPTACDGYTFEGWSTKTYAVDNTSAADIDYTGTIPVGGATYYAVYSKTEGGGTPQLTNNYAKITSTYDLTNGNYLIVANNSGTYNAMNTTWKATYYLEGATVTPNEDVITTTDASIIWTIAVNNNEISFLNSESSDYLYIETSTSGTKTYYNIKLGNNTTDNKYTYSVTNGEWTFTSATYTDRVLEYHVANTRWAYYTGGDAPIYLYKQQSETGSTTYHTTAPNCCTATITITSNNEAWGTVSFVE